MDHLQSFYEKSDPRTIDVVTELHGSIHYARCMKCSYREHRRGLQSRIESVNDSWMRSHLRKKNGEDDEFTNRTTTTTTAAARPDGDFYLPDDAIKSFVVPPCLKCGEQALAPGVVLFGDSIPSAVKQRAHDALARCSLLLVAGSSLQVPSAFHFVRECIKEGKPIILFNKGPTRLDEKSSLEGKGTIIRVEGKAEDTLPALVQLLNNSR